MSQKLSPATKLPALQGTVHPSSLLEGKFKEKIKKKKTQRQGKTQRGAGREKAGYEITLAAPQTTPELRSPPAQLDKSH